MNYITIIVLIFALIGALDRILGNRFGLGKEFEKGFNLLGVMMLTMTGMISLAPLLGELVRPLSEFVSSTLGIDASIIPATLLANDMGGAPLALEMAQNEKLAVFNAYVVSSMMGCTVSFTIPFAIGMVDKKQHGDMLLGLLCGIVTIPIGCFIAGLISKIGIGLLLIDLLPLILFSVVLAIGIIFATNLCVKIFTMLGKIITIIITVGLALGIFSFLMEKILPGKVFISGLAPIEDGANVCLNAAIVLAGAFPFVYILSKLLKKPLGVLGKKTGLNDFSTIALLASLATCATAYGTMDKMDRKGVMLNAAFSVSGAFVFGSHLAYTMANDSSFVLPVIVGKIISGVCAVIVAAIVYGRVSKKESV